MMPGKPSAAIWSYPQISHFQIPLSALLSCAIRAFPHLGASYTVKTFVFSRRIGLDLPRRYKRKNNC